MLHGHALVIYFRVNIAKESQGLSFCEPTILIYMEQRCPLIFQQPVLYIINCCSKSEKVFHVLINYKLWFMNFYLDTEVLEAEKRSFPQRHWHLIAMCVKSSLMVWLLYQESIPKHYCLLRAFSCHWRTSAWHKTTMLRYFHMLVNVTPSQIFTEVSRIWTIQEKSRQGGRFQEDLGKKIYSVGLYYLFFRPPTLAAVAPKSWCQ